MAPSFCTSMAEYNRWMNSRLFDAAAKLTETQLFEDRGAFFGSLFETLNHIVAADLIWLHRFARQDGLLEIGHVLHGLLSPRSLREPVAQTLPALWAIREEVDEVICDLASRTTEQILSVTLHYSNTLGQNQAKNLDLLMHHFFNHQTHHRGQATTLLFQAGIDIGVTDLNALIPSKV